ncbi:hypothetical protein TWF718_005707 [Orbilia javanica]|uniref:Cutinase n=1 Tax=Orbilia javanica TaxID=47235 RepID=A0AAN8MZD5_9PEZI
MKFQLIIATLAALATAAPAPVGLETGLEKRQSVGITENEYTRGGCRRVIFFFARGSTEVGNLGSTVGPPTARGLKQAFGDSNVAVEGIDYAALLSTNFLPGGADLAGIAEMKSLFNEAATKCPNSILVGGGYSQGAALTHRAVEDLSTAVKNKIAGIVTFGDTQNLQDRGRIPNFPTEKTLIICNVGDAVCAGTLTILPAHLDYVRRVPEAVSFLTARIRAAGF